MRKLYMTPEQYNKATTIMKVLTKVKEKLHKLETICDTFETKYNGKEEDAIRYTECNGVADTGYSVVIAEHADLSGECIKLEGCYVGHAMFNAARDILKAKKEDLEAQLEEV